MKVHSLGFVVVVTLVALPHILAACPTDACESKCFFHGTCEEGKCVCKHGWKGENCDEPTCSYCGIHGTCSPDGNSCCCSDGWGGDRCDEMLGVVPIKKPACGVFGECICPAGQDCTGVGVDLIPVTGHRLTKKPSVEWRTFPECHCSVDDGCVHAAGDRKLLKFSTLTGNIGSADLFIGNPTDYSHTTDLYEWHKCHNHPHFKNWTKFRLINIDTGKEYHGQKSGSAVIDSVQIKFSGGREKRKYTDQLHGLSAGWADWYPYYWDCQWIDVTDVPLGNYKFETHANPDRIVKEINYDNNIVVEDLSCTYDCGTHGGCNFGVCLCDHGWEGDGCDMKLSDCEPECDGRSCGSDGCGGTCGRCLETFTAKAAFCTDHGTCECMPQCQAKECGDDGCGLSNGCGVCFGTDVCVDGVCKCDPICERDNLECGWDGCCGMCGTCDDGFVCSEGKCMCEEGEGNCATETTTTETKIEVTDAATTGTEVTETNVTESGPEVTDTTMTRTKVTETEVTDTTSVTETNVTESGNLNSTDTTTAKTTSKTTTATTTVTENGAKVTETGTNATQSAISGVTDRPISEVTDNSNGFVDPNFKDGHGSGAMLCAGNPILPVVVLSLVWCYILA